MEVSGAGLRVSVRRMWRKIRAVRSFSDVPGRACLPQLREFEGAEGALAFRRRGIWWHRRGKRPRCVVRPWTHLKRSSLEKAVRLQ